LGVIAVALSLNHHIAPQKKITSVSGISAKVDELNPLLEHHTLRISVGTHDIEENHDLVNFRVVIRSLNNKSHFLRPVASDV